MSERYGSDAFRFQAFRHTGRAARGRSTVSLIFSMFTYLVHVTTRSAHRTQLGAKRARPCRQVVLSGSTRPGRKPQRAYTHGVDRGKAPRATDTSCVTESLLARVGGLEATLTPRPLIPSVPLRPSEKPPQTPSKDPRKTLPSEPRGPVSAEDGRSFEYRLE